MRVERGFLPLYRITFFIQHFQLGCGPRHTEIWVPICVIHSPFLAREMLVELAHPERGTIRTTGLPVKLSETPGAIERRPPLHGEHTDEVLREAGFSADDIATLRDRGVL